MKRLLLIPLFCSLSSIASNTFIEEKNIGNRLEKYYDLNQDKKADFIEIYVSKKLMEKKEDLDFDGTFDRLTNFNNDPLAEYFKIVIQNKIGSTPSKKISYWQDLKLKKTFSLTQIDTNNDGKWDEEYKSSSDIDHKKEGCVQGLIDLPEELIETSIKAASMTDEYTISKWGHRIHKSCLDSHTKDWFLKNTEKAITQGLACLDRLGKAGGLGAIKNKISLSNLLKTQSVQVICHEKNYNWGTNTIAHATTGPVKEKTTPLKHPGISINPVMVKKYKSEGNTGEVEFVRTIFHEQLHNLGYSHNHDVEYPYTCEKCCIESAEDSKELRAAACKICSGNYNSATDFAYIKDITDFGELNFNNSQALASGLNYVKENSGNLNGMTYLAINLSGVFDPIGAYLADKIKIENTLNESQLTAVARAKQYQKNSLLKNYEKSSKIIADAFYRSYFARDPMAALQILKNESVIINEQLSMKDPDKNSQFVKDSIRSSLKKIINDIWINHYSGKTVDQKTKAQLNDLAYELKGKFKLLGP